MIMVPTNYASKRNQDWFPSIFNELLNDTFTPAKQFASPAVNVLENEKEYLIEMAAPGMNKEELCISIDNENELNIKLEKKNETKEEEKKNNYLRREFSYSSYQRSFIIPEEVDTEKIQASMKDGVLTVCLPKKEEKEKVPASRQIEIH